MGLGVLESTKWREVPGTSRLEDIGPQVNTDVGSNDLKRSADGIILVPQPTSDPNDPLNWPLRRRDTITFLLCMLSVLASTLSPLLAANTLTLLLWYGNRSITEMALLTGYHLLGVGIAGFFFVASSRVWGKRHSFILGTVIIIISSIWGGFSGKNYDSLVAARFFQGVGLAPFEACVNASVGDLYCVHERGKRMALTNLCLFGGAFFTPVIVGKSTETLGWEWTFWLLAIFASALLPVVYLYCPETTYNRDCKPGQYDMDYRSAKEPRNFQQWNEPIGSVPRPSGRTSGKTSGSNGDGAIERIENTSQVTLDLNDYSSAPPLRHRETMTIPWVSRKSIKLFSGRKTNESFFKLLLRPLPLFLHPGILWACLIQGALIGWTVLLGVILAVVMIQPPLSFDQAHTGYMYTGAFIGALAGFLIAGIISDPAARWMAKKNRGIFEPEFRLVLVIPQLIFGCAGLYGFGIASNDTFTYGWIWPDFFFGCVCCGMVLGAVASALYIVDAHADIEVEGFTCLLIFKNLLTFGLTFKAFDWYQAGGIKLLMNASGSAQIGICALSIPMYIFGKRNRAFFAHHDILEFFHVK